MLKDVLKVLLNKTRVLLTAKLFIGFLFLLLVFRLPVIVDHIKLRTSSKYMFRQSRNCFDHTELSLQQVLCVSQGGLFC